MQKNHFLLFKKLKNTESAQLCPDLGLPHKLGALLSRLKSGPVFFKYSKIWVLILKITIKRVQEQTLFLGAQKGTHFSERKAEKSAKNERERKLKKKSARQVWLILSSVILIFQS